MNVTTIIAIVAALVIVALVIAWILTSNKARAEIRTLTGQVAERDADLARKDAELTSKDADLIRREAEVRTAEALRESERKQHEQAIAEIKASQEKALAELKAGQAEAIKAAKTALELENEKMLKAREVMQFDHYGETPRYVQDEILKKVGVIAR